MNPIAPTVRLTLLSGLAVVLLAVVLGLAVFQLDSCLTRTAASLEESQRHLQLLHTIDTAHIHFKVQVQEWKNMLLRAREPAAFERHRTSFETETDAVGRLLRRAQSQMIAGEPIGAELAGLIAAHDELTRKYLDALKHLDPRRGDGSRPVDQMVRSGDRALSAAFDGAAERLSAHARQRSDETLSETKEAARQDQIVLGIIGAFGLAIALWVLLWTIYELRVRLRNANGGAAP